MLDKELIVVLNEFLSQMRFFNVQIKAINKTLDKSLLLFKKFEKPFAVPQEILSK
jgi:hypothetical protein